MVPAIENVEQVDAVQDAVFFAPKGRRRPGGPASYAVSSWDRAGWDEIEQNFCVFLQVETRAGIDTMKTTMARDWVDAVVVGPYDLSIDMGLVNERFHPEQVGAIAQIIENAHEIGKPCGMPSVRLEEIQFWWERGCTLFLYSAPEGMVQAHITEFMIKLDGLS
jgi:4-hydroxy-2-oxoheptanedioate aldolase